jgi:hypothetical protein
MASKTPTTSLVSEGTDRAVSAAAGMRAKMLERADMSGRMRELEGQILDMKRASLAVGSGAEDVQQLAGVCQKLERRVAVLEKSAADTLSLCHALVASNDKLSEALASLDV